MKTKRTKMLRRREFMNRGPIGICLSHRQWCHRNNGTWFVLVYETSATYGGPEEGGWYYQSGYAVQRYKVRGYRAACRLAEKLEREAERHSRPSSSEQIRVRVIRQPVDQYPATRPQYS